MKRPAATDLERLLVVKLADFGDALLTTPALSALRAALPKSTIDVLTTQSGASVYRHTSALVDDIIVFDSRPFLRRAPSAVDVSNAMTLARVLRSRRYGAVLSMHSLVTRRGALKHAALAIASGANIRVGLVPAGSRRGWHLTHRVEDRGYDVAHVASSMLEVAGAIVPGIERDNALRPAVFEPGEQAQREAERLIESINSSGRPVVAVHPGCGPYSTARRWPPERFAALVDRLTAAGMLPIVIGGPADPTAAVAELSSADVIDLGGRTDLATLGALLGRVAAYVGNDSGVSHLAVAMGAPSVVVFGPSNDVAWGPWSPRAPTRVVSVDVPCRPCVYVGHRLGDPKGCPTRDCLRWLSVETVFEAIVEVIAEAIAEASGDVNASQTSTATVLT